MTNALRTARRHRRSAAARIDALEGRRLLATVPSGFVVSKVILPRKPTTSATKVARPRMSMSVPTPTLTCSAPE